MIIIYNMIDLNQIDGFDWDEGNARKSVEKHDVSQTEAESIFSNDPLIISTDVRHSGTETRFNSLGRTNQGRLLHLTFTLRQRNSLIRIISVRDMNRKERAIYEKA